MEEVCEICAGTGVWEDEDGYERVCICKDSDMDDDSDDLLAE